MRGGALLRGELLALRAADVERRRVGVRAEVVAEVLAVELEQPSWRRWAACRNIATAMFFPAKGDLVLSRAAITVCERCGVRERCLASALAEEAGLAATDVSGIRGGRTPAQRVAMVRQRGAAEGASGRRVARQWHEEPLTGGVSG